MSDSIHDHPIHDINEQESARTETASSSGLAELLSVKTRHDREKLCNEGREFQSLDERAIRLWRLEAVILHMVLGTILLVVGCVVWAFSLVPTPIILLVWLLAIGVSVTAIIGWPKKCYTNWAYCLEPHTLELRYGVVWKVSVLIPLSRVQHVDLHRNPLERQLGLASLQIHTAGTRDASHELPGLDAEEAARLRQRLITFSNGESS